MSGSVGGLMVLAVFVGWAPPAVGQAPAHQTANAAINKSANTARLPYTAEYKITTVKTLANGSTITHESTEVDVLDSQGRQMTAWMDIPVSSNQMPNTQFRVSDSVAQTITSWSSDSHTAKVTAWQSKPVAAHRPAADHPCAGIAPTPVPPKVAVQPAKPAMEDPATKVHEEIAAMRARMRAEKQEEPPTIELMTPVSVHEDLGQVTILGLEAWGRRITTTTPAGALGNSAPLVNTWERWVTRRPGISGLLVRDVRDDLLNGKRTEELVKFTQSEPDPSVFQPPAGYEIENKEVPVPACPSTEGAEQPMAPIPPPPPPPEQ